MAKVLIIESDEGTKYLYKTAIKFQHIEVETSSTVMEGLNKIEEFKPTLILLDAMIEDLKNVDILKEIKKKIDTLPLIILTDMRKKDAQKEASIFGACEYLSKTESSVGDIIKKINSVIKNDK